MPRYSDADFCSICGADWRPGHVCDEKRLRRRDAQHRAEPLEAGHRGEAPRSFESRLAEGFRMLDAGDDEMADRSVFDRRTD